jgi:hypothetical protein
MTKIDLAEMRAARRIENWQLKIFNLQFSIPAQAEFGDKV